MSEHHYMMSLTEVMETVCVPAETITVMVDHGIVEPQGDGEQEWRFDPDMLVTLRCAIRLQRDLELDWAGVALALFLKEQVEQLRSENRYLKHQLNALRDANIAS